MLAFPVSRCGGVGFVGEGQAALSEWRPHGVVLEGISMPGMSLRGLNELIRDPSCSIFVPTLRIVKRMSHQQWPRVLGHTPPSINCPNVAFVVGYHTLLQNAGDESLSAL